MDIIWLMVRVWLDLYLLPSWMHDRTPEAKHPYRRMFTRRHQLKRRIVKSVWIGAALLILINPMLHILLVISLPAALLSFAILDETH
ncbi:hypothetical protein [Sansalvadorimonas verongulae]|uniref:hypothetical protein n=1 Tax=Sansalvadorimonas verongulae TaxID=2172824 RepID=UPI0012BD08B0|nr:hypothetical protein [Sansalvadorimonas verongulae]MTI14216.1 hypothetical protein [Sansalvadorimonas verongulae]